MYFGNGPSRLCFAIRVGKYFDIILMTLVRFLLAWCWHVHEQLVIWSASYYRQKSHLVSDFTNKPVNTSATRYADLQTHLFIILEGSVLHLEALYLLSFCEYDKRAPKESRWHPFRSKYEKQIHFLGKCSTTLSKTYLLTGIHTFFVCADFGAHVVGNSWPECN